MLFTLAAQSLLSRKKTAMLTLCSLIISLLVLLSVEHIRSQAKVSFNRSISGVDLVVGAPTGQLNLLLYSIFRVGHSANNIAYDSFTMLQAHPLVKWAIPIALGDSHRGFRVLGTTKEYFNHYQYGDKQVINFAKGKEFSSLFEVVIGAEVQKALEYQLGDKIVIDHGIGNTSFTQHKQTPFVITGILSPTGTPIDKSLHISLQGIEAIHLSSTDIKKILKQPNSKLPMPESVTAVMLGLNSKFSTFTLQREINNYANDRLMAILPGVAIAELWHLMQNLEYILQGIALLVLISSLFGLATMLLASMNERKTEIAVLRILGAGPAIILLLIILEALMLVGMAFVSASVLLSLLLFSFGGWLGNEYGVLLTADILSVEYFILAGFVFIATLITSLIPGISAYKNALHIQLLKS